MRILVLGGTMFLGRHIAAAALARDHQVTLFTRGRTNPGLATAWPTATFLVGDRDGGLDPLRNRQWDRVIDTSGYLPRVVQQSVDLLAGSCPHYTFISSVSVYRDLSVIGLREDAEALSLSHPDSEDVQRDYGALKYLAEQVVTQRYGPSALIIRPGLIVGPWDPTDRFTYWPGRVAEGGRVLAPGRPERRVQFLDVRDLATWILDLTERGVAGTFNATGPRTPTTMGDLLAACTPHAPAGTQITWVSEQFLADQGVGEWMELPLWIRETPDQAGFMMVDDTLARQAGLVARPVAETVAATLAWHQTRRPYTWTKTGLSAEREQQLLARWDGRGGA